MGEKQGAILPQYKGMPSEIGEELWQNPIYIDEEKIKRKQIVDKPQLRKSKE